MATKLRSWANRHNTMLTIGAASIAPILYLIVIHHFAVNSLTEDDWSVVPFIHEALHGNLSFGLLWSQHTESRYFLGNVVDVVFGYADRFDLRSVDFLSAATLIASYAGLLVLLRHYLCTRLTPVPVLIVSAVWFSLADVENALWAAQVPVFLTVFFFVFMLVAFSRPSVHRSTWVALGILCAVAASVSTLQGFACWPIGVICILWSRPWVHRVRIELVAWLVSLVVTLAVYLPGYNFSEGNICLNQSQCTYSVALAHPTTSLRFFVALIGNVIPGGELFSTPRDTAPWEILGAVLLAAALFILVRSWRERDTRERFPLPLLLIVFPLVVDATITLGRAGGGISRAFDNRYAIYNLIFLTGIVVYGLARIPTRASRSARRGWRMQVTYLAIAVLAIFLCVQVTMSTRSGLTNSRNTTTEWNDEARYFVNLDRVHLGSTSPACQLELDVLREPPATLRDVAEDKLAEFEPTSYRYFREQGPWLPPGCQP
jgi:hypothetical protein